VPLGTVMSRLSRARKDLNKNRSLSEDNLVPIKSAVKKNMGGEL